MINKLKLIDINNLTSAKDVIKEFIDKADCMTEISIVLGGYYEMVEKLMKEKGHGLPNSPSKDSYKNVCSSNMEIKPSGRDYGLLFR